MLEELNAETLVEMGAGNEAGQIGDGNLHVVVVLDDAEMRFERGKGVGSDFGFGAGNGSKEGALAGVGKANLQIIVFC